MITKTRRTMKSKFDIDIVIVYCLSSVVFILLFVLMAVWTCKTGNNPYYAIPVAYIFSAVFFWLMFCEK